MTTDNTLRNQEIHRAQEERMVRDTIILQKINKAHREAFKDRFPGQCEHILRLIAERLQAVMTKKPNDLTDPATWTATANEIQQLSTALKQVYDIHERLSN